MMSASLEDRGSNDEIFCWGVAGVIQSANDIVNWKTQADNGIDGYFVGVDMYDSLN